MSASSLSELHEKTNAELKDLYFTYYKKDESTRNRGFLIPKIAYRMQELQYGGLSMATKKLLNDMYNGEKTKPPKQSIAPCIMKISLKNFQLASIKNSFEEVSLGFDTLDPDIFKYLTKNTIEPALQGIDILLEKNIPIKLCVVVTRFNLESDEIIKFCIEKSIKKIRFYWFISRDNNDHSLLPTEEEYNQFLENIKKHEKKIDLKVNRYYKPYTNIVVNSFGEIFIATDEKREKMQKINDFNILKNKEE